MKHMENLSIAHKHKSCSPCSQGKATRALFKQDQQNRYALLDAVSSDTTGPITPADAEGKKYVPILVDACSGWTDVQIMAKKSDAANTIMRPLAKIQRICQKKAKTPRTDGSTKQDSKKLRGFLDSNGTNATRTSPNASQSNAFDERGFRQLMAAARTAMAAAPHMPKSIWSHAVLDAADKGNYLATAKECGIQPS